jgi:ERCC4-type nuclease
VSSVPEKFGADFMFVSPVFGRVGVQRKEISDLIASLRDDRVSREVQQLQALDQGVFIIEGRVEWTNDGALLSARDSQFTKTQYQGICWSLQSSGFWLVHTGSMTETIESLLSLSRWAMKARHTSLLRRAGPAKDAWGTVGSKETMIHIMQGFPGVGYELGKRIVDQYGKLPLALTKDLSAVRGVGPKMLARIEGLLDSSSLMEPPSHTVREVILD